MSTLSSNSVVSGKFGFYPCEWSQYRKLKRLFNICYIHLKAKNRYDKWSNKQPQNRISGIWARNQKGQKVKWIPGDPIPEPRMPCQTLDASYQLSNYIWEKLSVIIEADYQNARYPKQKPEDVKPLILSPEKIDELLAKAEAWYKNFKSS